MNQRELKVRLEGILADLNGTFDAHADVPKSTVAWLLKVTKAAAFGEAAVELDHEGALAAFSALESVLRYPMVVEVHLTWRRSGCGARRDFNVEFSAGPARRLLAWTQGPELALTIMDAMRSLAEKGEPRG